MAKERVQRRIAAILATDVAGYSRLIREDEEGTLAAVKSDIAEAFDPNVAAHNGRIFKTMGDGLLVEFASVVDAVRCAVEVQRVMATRNATRPEDRKIEFRIGINLGDVVAEGDDLHGDGVNVSARLEGLADPGGIFISGTTFDQIHKNVDVGYEFLGEQKVKNIADPVRVYRVLTEPEDAGRLVGVTKKLSASWKWPTVAASLVVLAAIAGSLAWLRPWQPTIEPASVERMAFPLPDKPSIAVLPFTNLSDDPEQEYFAHGITDDLITDLSKLSGLFVIARNSSFAYKGQQVKVRQVAEDLGVRYILEGSVRRAGNQARINAQLIDAMAGGHLWAERYEGAMEDIFALQDSVIGRIVSGLAVKLTVSDQITLAVRRENVNLEAYDYLLRGKQLLSRIEGQDTQRAKGMFEKAIEIDPAYARAYLNLGLLYLNEWTLRGRARDQNLARAIALGQKAAELDPALAGAHVLIAEAYLFLGEHDKAEVEGEKAIALNPTHAETLGNLGAYLVKAGPSDKAIEVLTKAVRLDPYHPPDYLFFLGRAFFGSARYEEAVKVLRKGVSREPNYIAFHLWLAASYAMLERGVEAQAEVIEVLRLNPDFTLRAYAAWARNYTPPKNRADMERRLSALRKAGIPE
jgi:adenylate cyclase